MTRDEFIQRNVDALAGMILEAYATHRTGGELSLHLRQTYQALRGRLAEMYDQLQPRAVTPAAGANGRAARVP